jgi:ribosomal protein S18 acetylase RimI-like enzyme
MTIEELDLDTASDLLPELVDLLQDAVGDGASVGFLPPLSHQEALAYWGDVLEEVEAGTRVLLAARDEEGLAGAVQLELPGKPNASHRAEVQKLIVHTRARRRGLGRALLEAAERRALQLGRTLLVLDTRQGDAAEQLYRKQGYTAVGVIPGYARSANGQLDGTVVFYRQLG